jgi:nitroimidazol reductase NimA-like FMN-containing flavoprotein (pyridoxamine 5'-phosphate oxidase superfamily)
MRRKEKEIKDIHEIEAIIQKAEVCRLGLAVDNTPYVVPVNYGYENNCLYIHCAKQGRKIDMIRQNNRVCFEMDIEVKIWDRDKPACDWSSSYRSVIGYGQAFLSEDFEEKKQALDIIMKHYSDKDSFQYPEEAVENVGIIKIVIDQLSGKKSGDRSPF